VNDRGFQWRNKTLTLHIYIQPNAAETAFAGLHDGYLKFRVNAPPVEGKANAQLTLFLSRLFAVPKKSVHLQQGSQSRYKKVVIDEPRQLPDWIDPAG
jgi:uncharacterized protein (TIGR00251 family)